MKTPTDTEVLAIMSTYHQYWLAVLGDRTAREVVDEFDLADEAAARAWLHSAEEEAARAGYSGAKEREAALESWRAQDHAKRALGALIEAIYERDSDAGRIEEVES